jgi:phage shock protein A
MALRNLLDALLSQAEDPRERIRALVRELRGRQVSARRALGLAIALEKRLLDDLVTAEDAAADAERQAKEALTRGEQEAAANHVSGLLELRRREELARGEWGEQRAVADRVRKAVVEAARRTQEVAHAHTILLARAHCAEAASAIADTLRLLESPEIRTALGRASLRVEEKEQPR